MKALSLFVVVLLTCGSLAQAKTSLLLIGNKSEDTLSFVNTATLEEVAKTATGRGPHEVVATPDGRTAFVANYEGPGDSISVIDVPAHKETSRIELGEHRAPHGLALNRAGTKLYATCEKSQTVIEVDVESKQIVRSFNTDKKGTHMLALTPDDRTIYTADIGSGTATVIDLQNGEVVTHIETGAECEGIDVSPDGKQVWTSNRAADTLSVIDTATNKVVATMKCAGFPIRVKFTPDGKRVLVPCAKSNELAVFDVESQQEIKRVSTGTAPVGVLVEPGGRRAFVAYTGDNTVAVFNLETMEVTDKIPSGKQADGMALATFSE
ncbi:MAG: beta-propeller fold lactonase family protein [Chthoniobacterales bacterium]|nr:beta-propeller fold lactonase family protein [Chthoniobacterales bacterium]